MTTYLGILSRVQAILGHVLQGVLLGNSRHGPVTEHWNPLNTTYGAFDALIVEDCISVNRGFNYDSNGWRCCLDRERNYATTFTKLRLDESISIRERGVWTGYGYDRDRNVYLMRPVSDVMLLSIPITAKLVGMCRPVGGRSRPRDE